MSEQNMLEADVMITLSSERIADIVELYFNKNMLKQRVKVVDLKPTDIGYAFFVAYVPKMRVVHEQQYNGQVTKQQDSRDNKGRFVKSSKVND